MGWKPKPWAEMSEFTKSSPDGLDIYALAAFLFLSGGMIAKSLLFLLTLF
jgi:hypothetical protein